MAKEEMFNAERKQRFIESVARANNGAQTAQTEASYRQLFCQSAKYETSCGKDLCEFLPYELREYLESTASLRDESKIKKISAIKNYISWCKNILGVYVSDAINDTLVTGVGKIRRSMVSGPAHLQRVLDTYYEKVDMKTVDNIYRCFFWLAFAGVDEDDIMSVKCKDVNVDAGEVKVGDTIYVLERQSIPALRIASILPYFMYYHPNYGPVYKDRADGDTLIRGFSVPNITTVRNQVSIRSKASSYKFPVGEEVKLTHYRVWLSGHFYRIFESERSGVEPNFTELAELYVTGKSYSGDNKTVKKTITREKRAYRTDYDRWKLAFQV